MSNEEYRPDGEPFSLHLKHLREGNGYTQDALGEKLSVTRQTISSWERGRTEPDIASLKRLAELYNVTLDDLLVGYGTHPKDDAMAKPAAALFIAGLLLSFAAVWGLLSGHMDTGLVMLVLFPCAVMNGLMYTVFTVMIRSGDFTMLAGFHSELHYHMPALRKMVGTLRFWWCLSGVVFGALVFGLNLVPEFPEHLHAFVLVFYILDLVVGALVISHRFQGQLLPDKRDEWAKRASSLPLILFFAGFAVLFFSFIISFSAFGLKNNTPESALASLPLLLGVAVLIACLLSQQGRAARAARAGQEFRMHPAAWAGYGSMLFFAAWIVLACASAAF